MPVQVRVAVSTIEYHEASEYDRVPVTIHVVEIDSAAPLGPAIVDALRDSGVGLVDGAESGSVLLTRVSDEETIDRANVHAIDFTIPTAHGYAVAHPYEWFSSDYSLADVRAAQEEALYPPHAVDFFLVPTGEWGDAGSAGEIAEIGLWLLEHGFGAGQWIGASIGDFVPEVLTLAAWNRGARAWKLRQAVQRWREAGIANPRILREFVEKKREWDEHRLAKLLRLDAIEARQLLHALGYKRHKRSNWRRGNSLKALRRRDRWMRDEEW